MRKNLLFGLPRNETFELTKGRRRSGLFAIRTANAKLSECEDSENVGISDTLAKLCAITAGEKANCTKIKYWPIPSKMIDMCRNLSVADYLQFLEDRLYKKLSQEAHRSERGLITRSYHLVAGVSQECLHEHLKLKRQIS